MAVLPVESLPPLSSPLGVACLAFAGFCGMYIFDRLFLAQPLPKDVPLIREPKGRRYFSLRTRWDYTFNCEALFREAYNDYINQGKPVILPGFGFRNEVILPQSSMKWVFSQSEQLLNPGEGLADIDQPGWSIGHDKYIVDAWQGLLVRTELNRILESVCAAMNSELHSAFDDVFGTDTENWKELNLYNAMQMIISRAANRFTVGLPLSREPKYIEETLAVNPLLIMNAGLVTGLPRIFRPFVGIIFKTLVTIKVNKLKKFIIPEVRQRIAKLGDEPTPDEPVDLLQMMLHFAKRERPHEFSDEDNMSRRLILQNFGTIHNTHMQVVNLILNVLGSDAEFNTVAVLRDELDRVFESEDKEWTKSLVSQLVRADSASRETLRLGSFGGRANFRKVLAKGGLTTPEGIHLPYGATISFLSQPAQTDPEKLDDPMKFDPFRFSRVREEAATRNETVPGASFVSTAPDFMPFGHGKHACPGRFLVDFEMKMILSYVLRNYDIAFPDSYQGKRPPSSWMAEAVVPPGDAIIRVKRRVNKSS